MVLKIQPPAPNITRAVVYNEGKMTGSEEILSPEMEVEYDEEDNTGHVLATLNVPDTSNLENEFERLRWLNKKNSKGRKLENPTFHMSVNPGDLDKPMNEQEMVDYINEVMNELGYGQCPYRIYRHDDIERTHFHVVGTRIGQDGNKINDSFENTRCEKIGRGLATKYGYVYGLQEQTENEKKQHGREFENKADSDVLKERKLVSPQKDGKAPKTARKQSKEYIPPFNSESGVPASEQYRKFHEEAMKWSFTTPEQYAAILRYRYNTDVELLANTEKDTLEYTGLGKTGSPATTPINENELGIHALLDILQKCADTEMKYRKAQKKRLEEIAIWAAQKAKDWDDFRKLMEKKGIYTVVSWTEQDVAFGLTWLDRATRCAWKGSETDVDLNWLKKTVEDKEWKLTRHFKHEKAPRQQASSRKKSVNSGKNTAKLSSYSDNDALQQLMNKHGVDKTKRSNVDASKKKGDINYGDEKDNNDIII